MEGLPVLKRYITTHDAKGKAVFSDAVADTAEPKPVNNGDAVFGLQYCTEEFPSDLNKDKDIQAYEKYSQQAPGLVIGSGTVVRTVDMCPGHLSPMHRTVSLDYGIVLEGEVACVLDSGEERVLKVGDICVQRGTMHAWKNMSDTKPARMIYVLTPSKPFEVAGQKLGEDLADMSGVRSSS